MSANLSSSKFRYTPALRQDKYSLDPVDRRIKCMCCQDCGLIPESVLNRYVEVVPRDDQPIAPELISRPWDPVISTPMACSAPGCEEGPKWFVIADTWLTSHQCDWIATQEKKRWADEALHESGRVADLAARRAIQQASSAIGREMPAAPPPPEPIEVVAVGDDDGWGDF